MSVFLALLFVMQLLPMSVFAENVSEQRALSAATAPGVREESNIVSEIVSKRDANTKVYLRSDGSYTAVVSAAPLHYEKNGEWVEIDNTLEEKTVDGSAVLKNKSNSFEAQLPSQLTGDDAAVKLQSGAYSIAFKLVGEAASASKSAVNAELKSAEKAGAAEEKSSKAHKAANFDKLSGTAVYKGFEKDTDVEYTVTSSGVKENIILNKKPERAVAYTYLIDAAGLSAKKNADNSIDFSAADGKVIFVVPSPVMFDSDMSISGEIGVTLKENGAGSYSVTYAPSGEWLADSSRKYPVTVDPAVQLQGQSAVEDTVVSSEEPDALGDSDIFLIAMNSADGIAHTLIKPQTNLSSYQNANILGARLSVFGGVLSETPTTVEAYNILSSWSANTATYNNMPLIGTSVVDYKKITYTDDAEEHIFDITGAVCETGSLNNFKGIALKASTSPVGDGCMFVSSEYAAQYIGSMCPYFEIDYVETCGLNETVYDYHTQSVGRAGTAYLNDYSLSAYISRDELGLDGNNMPVHIKRYYCNTPNGALGNQLNQNTPYGQNWNINYAQRIEYLQNVSQEGRILYIGETGEAIYYKPTETIDEGRTQWEEDTYEGIGNTGSKLWIPTANMNNINGSKQSIEIVKTSGEKYKFNSNGMLSEIISSKDDNQKILITYCSTNSYSIDKITDGVGRKYIFTYTTASSQTVLSSIQAFDASGEAIKVKNDNGTNVDYKYTYLYDVSDGVKFRGATYPDGKSVYYDDSAQSITTALSNGSSVSSANIISIRDIDGYCIQYSRTDSNSVIISEMIKSEGQTDIQGNHVLIEMQGNYQRRFTDKNGSVVIKQFDKFGRTVNTMDDNGEYIYSTYTTEVVEGQQNNILNDVSGTLSLPENLIANNGFELDAVGWSAVSDDDNYTATVCMENVFEGNKAYTLSRTSAGNVYVTQEYTGSIKENQPYSFSARVKMLSANGSCYYNMTAIVSYRDGTSESFSTNDYSHTNNGWKKVENSFIPTKSVLKVTVSVGISSGTGSISIDDVQLILTDNLVKNGDFNDSISNWDCGLSNFYITTCSAGTRSRLLDASVLNAIGEKNVTRFTQVVQIPDGSAGDSYSLGGWTFSDSSLPTTDNIKEYKIFASAYITDENSENYHTYQTLGQIEFNPHLEQWQCAKTHFTAEEKYDRIMIAISYNYQMGSAMFDGIELCRVVVGDSEESGTGVDTIGHCGCSYCSENCQCTHTYAPEGTVCTSESCPNCGMCTCEGCTEVNCSCRNCSSDGTCMYASCHRNYNYEENAGTTTLNVTDGTNSMQMTSSVNGNYIGSQTDINGRTTTYSYNQSNGMLNSVIDGEGNIESYTYNAMGAITSVDRAVSALTNNDQTMFVNYSYTNDRIISATHNGFTYNFEYDIWGNPTATKVGSQTLITCSYGTGANRDRLGSVTYGNGDTVTYSYDADNNITGISYDNGASIAYQYEYENGNLRKIIDNLNGLTTHWTNTMYAVERTADNAVIYGNIANSSGMSMETFGGKAYINNAPVTSYNQVTGETSQTQTIECLLGTDIDLSSTADWFGRVKSRQYGALSESGAGYETDFISRQSYTYASNNGLTTGNVFSFTNSMLKNTIITDASLLEDAVTEGEELLDLQERRYTYDGNGKLTGEQWIENGESVTVYTYTYDEAGQLVRTDDALFSTSTVYVYDKGGNLVQKKIHEYSASALGEVMETINLTYDSAWKDKLVSYDGTSITYDSIGNPLNYAAVQMGGDGLSGSLTWNGRQLETVTQSSNYYEYTYNSDGLRTGKYEYSDNTKTNMRQRTEYIWNGSRYVGYVIYDSDGSQDRLLKILYDMSEEPIGFILSDAQQEQTYFYEKSLHGDVIGIYDSQGEKYLTYYYDEWGNATVEASGNDLNHALMAVMLAFMNPLTYRGYQYDIETGLYYLQSRYYNPTYGRFINGDDSDILKETLGTLPGANLFAYCANDPVNFLDKSGFSISFSMLILIISIIVSIIQIVLWSKAIFSAKKDYYDEYIKALTAHTKNVIDYGRGINNNVYLLQFQYLKDGRTYQQVCMDAYNNLVLFSFISRFDTWESLSNDNRELLVYSMYVWDSSTAEGLHLFYRKKITLWGIITSWFS